MVTKVEKTDENYLQPKDAAKLIRKELKANFKDPKFSVKTKLASMTSSVDIKWTDGPTETEVKAIVDKYQGASFDPQQDLSTPTDIILDGRIMWGGPKFVCVERQLTLNFLNTVADRVCQQAGFTKPNIHDATEYSGAHIHRSESPDEERVNLEIIDLANQSTWADVREWDNETTGTESIGFTETDETETTETEEIPMEHTEEETIDEAEKLVKLIAEAKREVYKMMRKTKAELVEDAKGNGINIAEVAGTKAEIVAAMISESYGQEVASGVNKMIATKKATTAEKKAEVIEQRNKRTNESITRIEAKLEASLEADEPETVEALIERNDETETKVTDDDTAEQDALDDMQAKVEIDKEPETVEALIDRVDDLCNGKHAATSKEIGVEELISLEIMELADEVKSENDSISKRVERGEEIGIMELVDRSKEAQGAAQLDAANEMLNDELQKAVDGEDSVFEKVELTIETTKPKEYDVKERLLIQQHLRSPHIKSFHQVVEICSGNVGEVVAVIGKAYNDSHHEQRAKDARVTVAMNDLREASGIEADAAIHCVIAQYTDLIERWFAEAYDPDMTTAKTNEGTDVDYADYNKCRDAVMSENGTPDGFHIAFLKVLETPYLEVEFDDKRNVLGYKLSQEGYEFARNLPSYPQNTSTEQEAIMTTPETQPTLNLTDKPQNTEELAETITSPFVPTPAETNVQNALGFVGVDLEPDGQSFCRVLMKWERYENVVALVNMSVEADTELDLADTLDLATVAIGDSFKVIIDERDAVQKDKSTHVRLAVYPSDHTGKVCTDFEVDHPPLNSRNIKEEGEIETALIDHAENTTPSQAEAGISLTIQDEPSLLEPSQEIENEDIMMDGRKHDPDDTIEIIDEPEGEDFEYKGYQVRFNEEWTNKGKTYPAHYIISGDWADTFKVEGNHEVGDLLQNIATANGIRQDPEMSEYFAFSDIPERMKSFIDDIELFLKVRNRNLEEATPKPPENPVVRDIEAFPDMEAFPPTRDNKIDEIVNDMKATLKQNWAEPIADMFIEILAGFAESMKLASMKMTDLAEASKEVPPETTEDEPDEPKTYRLLIVSNRQGKLKQWRVYEYGLDEPLNFPASKNILKTLRRAFLQTIGHKHVFVELVNDDCHVCYKPMKYVPKDRGEAVNHHSGTLSKTQMHNLSLGQVNIDELVETITKDDAFTHEVIKVNIDAQEEMRQDLLVMLSETWAETKKVDITGIQDKLAVGSVLETWLDFITKASDTLTGKSEQNFEAYVTDISRETNAHIVCLETCVENCDKAKAAFGKMKAVRNMKLALENYLVIETL